MHRPRSTFLGALLALLVAAPVAFAADQPTGPGAAKPALSSDRVIVQWAAGTDHGDKVDARNDADVSFASVLGDPDFQLVEVEPGQAPNEAVAALEADPAVLVAERDGYRTLNGIPNDPLLGQLWGLRNTGAGINGFSGAVAGDDIDATAAWDRTAGSPSTVIADIDSGYRFDDPDLGPVAWTNPGEIAGNGVDDDLNGLTDDVHGYDFVGASSTTPSSDNDPTDDNLISGGHGLHTAGTMGGAGNNGVGITGVARNVRVMPLRVCANQPSSNEARCPNSSIISAINYAGNMGARAVNMSLGGNTFVQAEVNAIGSHPQTLYVISAGNDGGNNDGGEAAPKGHHYPCDYQPTTQAVPPSAVDNIVCVAATDQADGLAGFSDYGATSVDLGAPGTSTLSTYSAQATYFSESFETNDFASKWTSAGAGFGRAAAGDGPLTTFGMNDSPGAAPAASSSHQVTLTTGSAPPAGAGACSLKGLRYRNPGTGGSFSYSVLSDDVSVFENTTSTATGGSSMVPFNTVPITGLGGHAVKVRFTFNAGPGPTVNDGIWLDDLRIACYAPLSAALSYEFLNGTSMAAPHVTGAAGLLFSLKPTATVTEVRNALLLGGDPIASLSGKTTTGRRLDVAAALNQLVPIGTETIAPDTAILSGPEGSVTSTAASFAFARTDADAGAFECKLDAGAFAPCTSPTALTVAAGAHQFQVRAKVPSGIVDPTPAARSWTVSAPPPPSGGGGDGRGPTPTCKVPALTGKALGQAKSALSAAGCTLGKVTKPKAKKGKKPPALVVKSSSPAAGATPASGKVDLTLGKKPKPKRKHH